MGGGRDSPLSTSVQLLHKSIYSLKPDAHALTQLGASRACITKEIYKPAQWLINIDDERLKYGITYQRWRLSCY